MRDGLPGRSRFRRAKGMKWSSRMRALPLSRIPNAVASPRKPSVSEAALIAIEIASSPSKILWESIMAMPAIRKPMEARMRRPEFIVLSRNRPVRESLCCCVDDGDSGDRCPTRGVDIFDRLFGDDLLRDVANG